MSTSYKSLFVIGVPIAQKTITTEVKKFNEDDGSPYMKKIHKSVYVIEGTDIEVEEDIIEDTVSEGEFGSIDTGMNDRFFIGMFIGSVSDHGDCVYEFIDDVEDKRSKTSDYLKDTFGYSGEVYNILAQSVS